MRFTRYENGKYGKNDDMGMNSIVCMRVVLYVYDGSVCMCMIVVVCVW